MKASKMMQDSENESENRSWMQELPCCYANDLLRVMIKDIVERV